jgi:hypothetical protein
MPTMYTFRSLSLVSHFLYYVDLAGFAFLFHTGNGGALLMLS